MKTVNVGDVMKGTVDIITGTIGTIFAGGVITGLGIKKVVKGVMKNVK